MQRWHSVFALAGSVGLHLVVFANVGVAIPVLHKVGFLVVSVVVGLTIALNVLNYGPSYLLSCWTHLSYEDRVTTCLAGGMRSIGTALVVGLTTFPTYPLVTVPAAIYIIVQHLIAGQLVKFLHKQKAAVAWEAHQPDHPRLWLLTPAAARGR